MRYPREITHLVLIGIIIVMVSACAHQGIRQGGRYTTGQRQIGMASWYGKDFHGRPTSSGEIYDMNRLTAAHKTLPLGTEIRVEHLKNGRSVRVKVNDRGPFVGDRILDLSYAAAKELHAVEEGVFQVEIEIIKTPREEVGSRFFVQVGTYSVRQNADRMQVKTRRLGYPVHMDRYDSNSKTLYRVRVGPFDSEEKAKQIEGKLTADLSTEEEPIRPIVLRVR